MLPRDVRMTTASGTQKRHGLDSRGETRLKATWLLRNVRNAVSDQTVFRRTRCATLRMAFHRFERGERRDFAP